MCYRIAVVAIQGMFVVSVGEGSEDPDFQSLAKVADSDTPSLYVYKVNVTFPR